MKLRELRYSVVFPPHRRHSAAVRRTMGTARWWLVLLLLRCARVHGLHVSSYQLLRGDAVPTAADRQLRTECEQALRSDSSSRDAQQLALGALAARPLAVEVAHDDAGEQGRRLRRFWLPRGLSASVAELEVEDGSLGHCVWEASVALSIFLATDGQESVRGRRVLELGAGCGLAGITASLAGAGFVTLSERAEEPPSPWEAEGSPPTPLLLLDNLRANARRNRPANQPDAAPAPSCDVHVVGLEWDELGAEPRITPHAVVLGSELIYYEQAAPALAAAIIQLTAAGGVAYLVSRATRRLGLEDLLASLAEAGALQREEWSLLRSDDAGEESRTELLFVTFRKPGTLDAE